MNARISLRLCGVALAGALALAACGSSGGGAPATGSAKGAGAAELVGTTLSARVDTAAAAPLAQAEQAFAVDLLHRLDGHGGNVSVSPASLALALSMLANGASGTTRAELARVLHLSTSAANPGWQALTAAWAAAARTGSFQLSSANAAWLQKGFPVEHAFLDALRTYYGAGVWSVDFARHMSAALAAINAWTSRQTHGKIPKLFDQLDPATVLVLADAVYFKAAWQSAFDPSMTAPGQFTLASGKTTTAQFMSDDHASDAATDTPGYSAVQLPYRGGRFAALAIMPKQQSLGAYVSALTTAGLASVVSSLRSQPIALRLPKFTTRSTLGLNQTLAALGMPSAFDPHRADFSAMTPQSVFVGQVIQRVYLKVAEKGTEAAAATGIGMTSSGIVAPSTPIVFDHPFLFLIRDTHTGAILFASEVNNPGT